MKELQLFVVGDFKASNPSIVKVGPKLQALLDESDINICNFEAPIVDIDDSYTPIGKSGPSLCQPSLSADLVESLGFNVILMANNHIMDYGRESCEKTISNFRHSKVVGVGDAPYKPALIEINGFKIAFLSLVQHEFGIYEDCHDEMYGTAWIGNSNIKHIIEETKNKVDFVFVFPHAGIEHYNAPLPEWRNCYKNFITYGADAVIASHPHVPQGVEYYNNKPIFYSLGNFYFDQLTGGRFWNKSIGVKIVISDTKIEFTPILLCFTSGRIEVDTSEESIQHFATINNLLSDDISYNKYINKMCTELMESYKFQILRGLCGFSFKMRLKLLPRLFAHFVLGHHDDLTLLNTYQCESHRWVIERYYRTLIN